MALLFKFEGTNKRVSNRFQPKYKAFSILQNNIEEVVQKTTKMWKIIYGLATVKKGQEDPFKGIGKEEDKKDEEEKEEEEEKDEEEKEEEKKEEKKEEKVE